MLNNKDFNDKNNNVDAINIILEKNNAFECKELFLNKTPPFVPNSIALKARPLCYDGVAVLYSGLRKSPLYVAEIYNKSSRAKKTSFNVPNALFSDTRLPVDERASPVDYDGNIFGINFDLKINNGIPMAPEVSRRKWAVYEEQATRNINQANGNVYVITGSVFTPNICGLGIVSRQLLESDHEYVPYGVAKIVEKSAKVYGIPSRYDVGACTIGNGVIVPTFIYKLVFDSSAGRAWAYWIENTNSTRIDAPISYAELVRRTGINFFPGVKIF
ncbi:MAG: DNA/RNA non-specific endonuclease [Leadbetterella sp.]|nr:DNA/RNA non-specific endonuclease [Leadbetterella sp.]